MSPFWAPLRVHLMLPPSHALCRSHTAHWSFSDILGPIPLKAFALLQAALCLGCSRSVTEQVISALSSGLDSSGTFSVRPFLLFYLKFKILPSTSLNTLYHPLLFLLSPSLTNVVLFNLIILFMSSLLDWNISCMRARSSVCVVYCSISRAQVSS